MKKKSRASLSKVLMILWLMTAAAVLVVTVVYFGELQKLYSAVGRIEEEKASGEAEQMNTSKNVDAAAITDVAVYPTGNDGLSDPSEAPPVTEAPTPGDDTAVTGTPQTGDTPPDTPEPTDLPESGDTELAYYHDGTIDPSKPIIALSFDDGPSVYTVRILEALKKYNAKATFFMVGYNIETHKDEVKAVYEAGCEIGNHTTDHTSLKKGKAAEIKARVYDNEDLINTIVPVGKVIVRPPYGDYNDTVKELIARPMFNWSVDSLDWKTRNADSVVKQIQQDAKDGYIILMHDLYESTAEATERIIPWLIEQGYQVTCVSDMFKARGEEVLDGHVYRLAKPAE